MALTQKQNEFLNLYIRKTEGRVLLSVTKKHLIAKKQKKGDNFSLVQDSVTALLEKLDPSSPQFATLQMQRDSLEGYGNQGKFGAGTKFGNELIKKLEKEVAKYPKQVAPPRPTAPTPVTPLRQAKQDNPVKAGATLAELKELEAAATQLEAQANPAGLSAPALITTALSDAKRLLAENKTDGVALTLALEAFDAARDALWDFFTQWKQAGLAEGQARKQMPAKPAVLVTAIDTDWEESRQKIGEAFIGLGATDSPDAVVKSVSALQTRIEQRRNSLSEILRGTTQSILKARQTYQEFSRSRLYQLDPARVALEAAESGFADAVDQAAINLAHQNLREFERLLEEAKKRISKEQLGALERYQELLHKVNVQVLEAQTVRGALVENSPVKLAIDEVIKTREAANQMLAKALTTSQVEAAIQKLKEAQAADIPKEAEKLAVKEKEKLETDIAALPKYEKAFEELVSARAILAGRPGAQKQFKIVQDLMTTTRVLSSGQPKDGFANALDAINKGDVAKLLRESDKAAKDYVDTQLNGFAKDALEETQKLISAYAECHGSAAVNEKREALARATEPPDKAYQQLNALAITLRDETRRQRERQATLGKSADERQLQLDELSTVGMKPTDPVYWALKLKLQSARDQLAEWLLDEAEQTLKDLETGAKSALDAFVQAKKNWEATKKALNEALARAQKLAKAWDPIASTAREHIAFIPLLLEMPDKGGKPLEEVTLQAEQFLERARQRLSDLMSLAQVDEGTPFDNFQDALDQANKEWQQALGAVAKRIQGLDDALKKAGVAGGAALMGWPEQLAELDSEWGKARSSQLKLDGKQTPEEAVAAALAAMLESLKRFAATLDKPETVTTTSPVVATGKAKQLKVDNRAAFDTANRLLLECRALQVEPIPKDAEARLGVYADTASKEKVESWVTLAKELQLLREKHLESAKKSIEEHRKTADKLAKAAQVKFLQFKKEKFSEFFADMEQQVNDALAMLNAVPPDPMLIKAAGDKLAAIQKTLDDAQGKGGEGAVTMDEVLKVQKELNGLLGIATILDRMPDTHRELSSQMDQAYVRATSMPPDKGILEFEALRGPILDAGTKSLYLQQQYTGFKSRLKEVKARFKEMQKHTGTTLGDRPLAYIEQFDARVGEANALAHQEGQIEAALIKLDQLDKVLVDLLAMKPEAATEAVKKLEADAEAEQRTVRDLARTFNATIDYWQDELLPEIAKAVKLRGKKEEEDEHASLKSSVKSIGKTVAPYLAVISKLPTRRLTANAAPDMASMRNAFSEAYMRLNQLLQPALRLRDGSGSTTVTLETDMAKLQDDWKKRVGDARHALANLGTSLEGLTRQVDPAIPKEDAGYVDLDALETATQGLKTTLNRLAGHFSESAFSGPLQVLADQASAMNDRKKAREEALRTVRKLVADVAGNPLLQKLYEGKRQGLLELDVRPPISFLHAELKKIELAVLVGI